MKEISQTDSSKSELCILEQVGVEIKAIISPISFQLHGKVVVSRDHKNVGERVNFLIAHEQTTNKLDCLTRPMVTTGQPART